jgi:hypothetical protein
MPTRLQRRASALHAVTLSLRTGEPLVDAGRLSALASACRDGRALRFRYRKHAGETDARHVQPQRLANYGRRWYLVAWDVDRADWRTFRIDRIEGTPKPGEAFAPRPLPADVAARLERGIAYAPFTCRVTLRLAGSVEELQAVLPLWCGVVEPETDTHSLLHMGAETPEGLLAQVLMIDREVAWVDGNVPEAAFARVLGRLSAVFSSASERALA